MGAVSAPDHATRERGHSAEEEEVEFASAVGPYALNRRLEVSKEKIAGRHLPDRPPHQWSGIAAEDMQLQCVFRG